MNAAARSAGSPRVLLAILVYNGRPFVPRCLESAASMQEANPGLDVLVLDDASPEPGWSDELESLCSRLGAGYYRSPRNIGIPRNMNLALLHGKDSYDYVIVSNSDVIFPANLPGALVDVARSDPRIGSVTAWSNNVSIYSLANSDAAANLSDQAPVDWVSEVLAGEFGNEFLEVPAAVGFCMCIPSEAISEVGLFDPVYGKGYCEEVDWSLRSRARGMKIALAPGSFVYHIGQGSTRSTGILAPRQTTVASNEEIVHLRYPLFRAQVGRFEASGECDVLRRRAAEAIVREGARRHGYQIDAAWLPGRGDAGDLVRFVVDPAGRKPVISAEFMGFACELPLGDSVTGALTAFTGRPPSRASLFGAGSHADLVAAEMAEVGIPVSDHRGYPEAV